MATAQYLRGERLSVVALAAADVVVDEIVPVDRNLLVSFETVSSGTGFVAYATGVYKAPKVAGTAIVAGEPVGWKAATQSFDHKGVAQVAGDILGCAYAVRDAAAGATEVEVCLTPNAGALT